MATLGILIPPSIPLIIYGAAVGAPVTLLFAAGIIPGLVVLASMMLMVLGWSILVPGSAGETRRYTWKEKLDAFVPVLPFVILIASVFSVLYLGIATPTEAGAVGAAISALIVAFRRQLTWKMITESLAETAVLTSSVLIIVVGSGIFGWVVDYARVPQIMVELVKAMDLAPWLLMVGIVGIYVVLGMFIDPISMILMTVSITFPLVALAGYDAIWFGIALMMVAEIRPDHAAGGNHPVRPTWPECLCALPGHRDGGAAFCHSPAAESAVDRDLPANRALAAEQHAVTRSFPNALQTV